MNDFYSYRRVLEEKARQRKVNRSKSIHEKSHTVSNLCNIRKELAEDSQVLAEIKSVLCPRKAPAVKQGKFIKSCPKKLDISAKRRKPAKIESTISNAKQRLIVKHRTIVKQEEIQRIKKELGTVIYKLL